MLTKNRDFVKVISLALMLAGIIISAKFASLIVLQNRKKNRPFAIAINNFTAFRAGDNPALFIFKENLALFVDTTRKKGDSREYINND